MFCQVKGKKINILKFRDKNNILAFLFFFFCSFFNFFSSELFIINLSLELGLCCVGAESERVGELNDSEVYGSLVAEAQQSSHSESSFPQPIPHKESLFSSGH